MAGVGGWHSQPPKAQELGLSGLEFLLGQGPEGVRWLRTTQS